MNLEMADVFRAYGDEYGETVPFRYRKTHKLPRRHIRTLRHFIPVQVLSQVFRGKFFESMTLDACEFIRRFLLHVLPDGVCKIRYYGFMSNRKRQNKLALCRTLLGVPVPVENIPQKSWEDVLLELTGVDVRQCPNCHVGRMHSIRTLKAIQHIPP